MIKRIKFENFRSFVKAEAELRPFTLIIGANGAGKSNFLRWFECVGGGQEWVRHISHAEDANSTEIEFSQGVYTETSAVDSDFKWEVDLDAATPEVTYLEKIPFKEIPIYSPDPAVICLEELVVPDPCVRADGSGTAQVLDFLKNGNREDLFQRIEENFRRHVPEVEKLSLLSTSEGKKIIQVREKGLGGRALPASELSKGTRLILCILTIIHQESPPSVILLEDVDRGMHPRIFKKIAPLMRQIAQEHDINIIATTHNPYLVDAFQDSKDCVLLVEKVDGASTLVPLTQRLKAINHEEVESDMPLGQLWFSGLIEGDSQLDEN